jgi:hypothetical protein
VDLPHAAAPPLALDNHAGVVGRAVRLVGGVTMVALGLGTAAFLVSVVTGAFGAASGVERFATVIVGSMLTLVTAGAGIRMVMSAVAGAGQVWTVDPTGIHVRERTITGREVSVHVGSEHARSVEFEELRGGEDPEWRLVLRDADGRRFCYPLGTDRKRAFATHDLVLDTLYGRVP